MGSGGHAVELCLAEEIVWLLQVRSMIELFR